jgi:hypothetical protein
MDLKNEARRAENVSMVLRNHDEFFVPTSRLKTYENFPLYSFPKLWLNLQSDSIKIIRNVYDFNLKLKGTVSRDFLLLVFFMNQFPPSPRVSH